MSIGRLLKAARALYDKGPSPLIKMPAMRQMPAPLTVEDLIRHIGCPHATQHWVAQRGQGGLCQPTDLILQGDEIAAPCLSDGTWQVSLEALVKSAHTQTYEPLIFAEPEASLHDILRLMLGAVILEQHQGIMPQNLHLQHRDGQRAVLRAGHYIHYLRDAQTALFKALTQPPLDEPQPCEACAFCEFSPLCQAQWRASDSLYALRGLSKSQIKKLKSAGITTKAALVAHDGPLRGFSEKVRLRVSATARLAGDPPAYVLLPAQLGKGYGLLPRPNDDDMFYHFDDTHQLMVRGQRTDFGADESDALMAAMRQGLKPQAHIYIFGAQSLTALKTKVTQTGQQEALLDRLLREKRFVDLALVVRGAVLTSVDGHDLGQLAAYFGPADLEGLGQIKALRDWLISIRPDHDWPQDLPEASEKEAEEAEEIQTLRQSIESAPLTPERKELLFNLSQFHKRELKPAQWAVFDSLCKEDEELYEALDALAGLQAIGPIEPVKRSFMRRYRYVAQETKLSTGKKVTIAAPDGGSASLTIENMQPRRHEITLKAGPNKAHLLQDELTLHPDWPLDTKVIAQALQDVIQDQCGPKRYLAIEELLSRHPPRLSEGEIGPLRDGVADITRAVLALDNSVLPIQGPPGTGKTYVTARAILALLAKGQRVGVASNSHEAIRNLMMGVLAAMKEADLPLRFDLIHKTSSTEDGYPQDCAIERTTDNKTAEGGGHVVGGTAFFFARPENIQAFDYLIVDEAGQVGLATLTAMARAARNLVLVGDPQQLPQVIQGAHPAPANLSCLEWLLGDQSTIEEGRGFFLPLSRRMHPKVCAYISEQIYEDRLQSHPQAALRAVFADGLPQAGAYWVPVAHDGNKQNCPEEVAAIKSMIALLLAGKWQEADGSQRALMGRDIIVVAPYNAQVNALREALPADIRIGTVDKFQGQEAPVCLVSMTGSSAEEAARGMEFLFSANRMNVAVSRAKALALVFGSPLLRQAPCRSIDELRMVNRLCALPLL